MRQTNIRKKEFGRWLQSKEPRQRVGRPMHVCCPIATFIAETSGRKVKVWDEWGGLQYVAVTENGKATKLPKWAETFSSDIDQLVCDVKTVTAVRALNVLWGARHANS